MNYLEGEEEPTYTENGEELLKRKEHKKLMKGLNERVKSIIEARND